MSDTPENDKASEDVAGSEPIDAEFEPADDKPETTEETPPARSGISMGAVAACSVAAALAGGAIGVVGSGSSGVDTAKFARAEVAQQVSALETVQDDLNTRLQKVWSTVSQLEARTLGESERMQASLDARQEGERVLRSEVESLMAQLDAIIGEDPTAEPSDAPVEGDANAPAVSPLQRLSNRLSTLETRLAEDTETPTTTGQLRRTVKELTDRVNAAEAADADLSRALDNRAEALAALQTGLFTATKSISDLEDQVVRMGEDTRKPAAEDAAGAASQIDALKAEIAALRAAAAEKPATPPLAESPATTEIASPEDAIPSDDGDTERARLGEASLALAKVETDAARGKPFPSAWDRLKAALPDNDDVNDIRAISRTGAPTLGELRTSFDAASKPVLESLGKETKGDGWDWARQAFGGVVNVRRTDAEDDSPVSRLARMDAAIADGDLAAALKEVDALEGEPADALSAWKKDAQTRLTFDATTNAISQQILSRSQSLAQED